MPQDAFLALSSSKNAFAVRHNTNPAGGAGAYIAPPDSLAGVEGARCPLPKNPSPLSAFDLEFLSFVPQECPSHDKFLATPFKCRSSLLLPERERRRKIKISLGPLPLAGGIIAPVQFSVQ